jgi:hypothetical protein
MKPMFASVLYLFVGLSVLGTSKAFAVDDTANPSLQKIIERTLLHDDERQKALQTMQYDQTADLDELNAKGEVTRHETLQMIIYPGGNPSMKIVSVKGDHIPADPDQAEAQAKGRDVEGNKDTFTLRALVNRFDLALAEETELAGHHAYVIAFTPKPNQPYHDETEKIVNQLHGRMWISSDSYDVLQTEASLAAPVSIAWFLASIPQLDFHYSRLDLSKEFTPCQVQITLQVQAMIVGFHQRQSIAMTNFKPRG